MKRIMFFLLLICSSISMIYSNPRNPENWKKVTDQAVPYNSCGCQFWGGGYRLPTREDFMIAHDAGITKTWSVPYKVYWTSDEHPTDDQYNRIKWRWIVSFDKYPMPAWATSVNNTLAYCRCLRIE